MDNEPPVEGFTAEELFENSMLNMMLGMRELNIAPDSLLRCSEHGELMFDPDNHFQPTEHLRHGH